MPATPRTATLASAFLVASLLIAGCSAGGGGAAKTPQRTTTGTGTAAPDASETQEAGQTAYLKCLEGQGVRLATTPEGVRQVDKDHVRASTLKEAERTCADRRPDAAGHTGDDGPSAQQLAKARKLSECVRGEGFADYPDPDPKTGEVAMTEELARSAKGDPALVAALQKCGGATGGGGGKVGG
ncbi:hypothetical protein ACGFR8_28065 [Streptomyces brevispora]|uniref:hypothetical protein n=1 Tax=Streptomyces brevispora TaxID=887462 RepID=UPI003719E8C6